MSCNRLAVIDDNPDFARLVSRVAGTLGWSVDCYGDGERFISDAVGERPDLVLLDVLMRRRDGIEVINWMVAEGLDVPVVIVSGADPLYVRVARELSAAGGLEVRAVLGKPVAIDALRGALARPAGPEGGDA